MNEPQLNNHQRNCLPRTQLLTDVPKTEDMADDTVQIRDSHQLPYIGDFPPKPSDKKHISC